MTLRADANVVEPDAGLAMDLGYTRLRVVLSGEDTDGAFALTEQPLEAGALAGPLHTHANEDGFIYGLVAALVPRSATTPLRSRRAGSSWCPGA